MATDPTSIADLLHAATARLQEHSGSARLDAEILLCKALDCDRSYLYAHSDKTPTLQQQQEYSELLEQREHGRPVAYLTGQQEFWSLQLQVTPSVLVPRADTEHLVELALQAIAHKSKARVLDLGTGSGAVALALASERPDIQVIATDQSRAALDVALSNCRQLGLDNVECIESDWFSSIAGKAFDLVVSNPPYIPAGDPHLSDTGVRFEPVSALVSGRDGMDDIRHISQQAIAHLVPGGQLMLEHGHNQGRLARQQLLEDGYTQVITSEDATGNDRVTHGTRQFPQHNGPD